MHGEGRVGYMDTLKGKGERGGGGGGGEGGKRKKGGRIETIDMVEPLREGGLCIRSVVVMTS